MMVCMNEWAHHASIWVAPQKLRLLSLFRDKSFFIFCTFAGYAVSKGGAICFPVPAGSETGADRSTGPARPVFTCNTTKEEYCHMVEKAKGYIRNGDIFQAVISRRFETEYRGSLLDAYRVLRTTNPSPYMVMMQIDDAQVISTSPETLVRLKDGVLTTFPLAGTRPRGRDEREDKALEEELLADEKELAEHDMLVDLARNDLGKISRYDSVRVTKYRMVLRYSRVMHIASEVESLISGGKEAGVKNDPG